MTERPLCFVLMPFGTKPDPTGGPPIDFDAIYDSGIRPAVEDAELEPLRADAERAGGIIHRAMFERLLLCDFAIADLTTANANVFYELGVRHATRPATTVPIFAARHRPPFDVSFLRALPYELSKKNRLGSKRAERLRQKLGEWLKQLREAAREEPTADSPVFQLLQEYGPPDVARLKTDVFRERTRYAEGVRRELATARAARDAAAVAGVEERLGELDAAEAGVLVDLVLSYRAVEAYGRMVELYERLPGALRRSILVREQYALALNRELRHEEARRVLEEVLDEQGPSSETCSLLGRVYKDLWQAAGDEPAAEGFLDRAIANYDRGFVADSRDAYPGINVLTLLEAKGDADSLARKTELLPVVRFAVDLRLRARDPDYWDHATLLELAVLEDDEALARRKLQDALAHLREPFEARATAGNLQLLRRARKRRGVQQPWLRELEQALLEA